MHFIHAGKIGETPWGWRDGVVSAIGSDGWLEVEYLAEPGSARAWHHRDLTERVGVGDPVRLHEQYYALALPSAWLCVFLEAGIGAVPAPADPELWRLEMTVGVTDLSTGEALPMDRPDVGDA
jgi:hypothetical protein